MEAKFVPIWCSSLLLPARTPHDPNLTSAVSRVGGGSPHYRFFSGGYIEISHFKVANKGLVVGNKGRKRYF